MKPRTGPNNTLGAVWTRSCGLLLRAAPPVPALAGRDVAAFEEVLFFELAGFATTFFFETGLVFFDVDFPVLAFFLPAATFFPEVFFEVPFLPDDFVAFWGLFADRCDTFRRLAVPRPAAGFRADLLPVFFFFLAAALLPGI
ncbi:MAG TPA: hypothetical protein VF329_01435 [Gammaproteobacteria bacterium]